MIDLRVQAKGADQALKALRALEPQVAREVGRQVSDIGRNLAAAVRMSAPGEPPVSGWTMDGGGPRGLGWGQVQATSVRRGMSVRVTATGSEPAYASLAESLGRGTKWRTRSGLNLVLMARERWGPIVQSGAKEGRVARAAVQKQYPQIMADLQAACDRASAEIDRRMP